MSGKTIKNAKFSIYVKPLTKTSKVAILYRLTQDWGEEFVTWDKADDGVDWSTPWDLPQSSEPECLPGGMVTVDDSARIDCRDAFADGGGWEVFDVTSIVQKFANGTKNFGFYIKHNDQSGNTGREYYSSENSNESERPKLEIEYGENAILSSGMPKLSNLVEFKNTGNNISFNISLDGNYRFEIISLQGKRIHSFSGNGTKTFFVDRDVLNSSCYLVSVTNNGKTFSQKMTMVR